MKVKKIIKTVITVLAVFIAVIIIKNPDKALATQTGEDDVYAGKPGTEAPAVKSRT